MGSLMSIDISVSIAVNTCNWEILRSTIREAADPNQVQTFLSAESDTK